MKSSDMLKVAGLLDPAPMAPMKDPRPNPILFQKLDNTFTRRQWLSSINSSRSEVHTNFPSDINCWPLRYRSNWLKGLAASPLSRLELRGLTEERKDNFNLEFCSFLDAAGEEPAPSDHTTFFASYTDGTGSRGSATACTADGWGRCLKQGYSWITSAGG